jgi:anaerobic carbon-monoxide dehydrogenase iron sulfur subunit
MVRTVFVDPERCIGCRHCEFACAVEASESKDPLGALFEQPRPHTRIHVEAGPTLATSYPNRCRHCDPAPCLQVCPTGAITRDADEDLVLVDRSRCIGCAMCAIVCPFDAVTFHPAAASGNGHPVATKCDGCLHLVRQGEEPACVAACKVDALVFGELNEIVAERRADGATRTLAAVGSVAGAAVAPATDGNGTGTASASVAAWRSFGTEVAMVAATSERTTERTLGRPTERPSETKSEPASESREP